MIYEAGTCREPDDVVLRRDGLFYFFFFNAGRLRTSNDDVFQGSQELRVAPGVKWTHYYSTNSPIDQ